MTFLSIVPSSRVKLQQVISKTVNPKTGTKVETGLNCVDNLLTSAGGDSFGDASAGITRLISYGKRTPLYKAGIHQAQITTLTNGSKKYQYFHKGKEIYSIGCNKENGKVVGGFERPTIVNSEFTLKTPIKERLKDSLTAILNVLKQVNG